MENKNYFAGWYFKHQIEDTTIIFISGINKENNGTKKAFIQVLTNNQSIYIPYDYKDCKILKHKLGLKIGNNIFTEKGINIDIRSADLSVKGKIKYGKFTKLKYPIMGPFTFFPLLECHHGVISMRHKLQGRLKINQKTVDFSQGAGYIERDWGNSFPVKYFWTQCNTMGNSNCSIMVSIADVPFCNRSFQGCISAVSYQGKEYRLATYLGAKIIWCDEYGVLLRQGSNLLKVTILEHNAVDIMAPSQGAMTRTVCENTSCKVRYTFWNSNQLLLDFIDNNASYEYEQEEL